MTVDVGLWQRPRWGVGSVRLHLDVEDLAWGMTDGATLPTCPNCDEPALLLKLLRKAKQKGPLRERRPPGVGD